MFLNGLYWNYSGTTKQNTLLVEIKIKLGETLT